MNNITNKEFKKKIDINDVVVSVDNNSLIIEDGDFYLEADLYFSENKFNCNAWVNDSEIYLTESQKDYLCNVLSRAKEQETEFDYSEQFHALSLIF